MFSLSLHISQCQTQSSWKRIKATNITIVWMERKAQKQKSNLTYKRRNLHNFYLLDRTSELSPWSELSPNGAERREAKSENRCKFRRSQLSCFVVHCLGIIDGACLSICVGNYLLRCFAEFWRRPNFPNCVSHGFGTWLREAVNRLQRNARVHAKIGFLYFTKRRILKCINPYFLRDYLVNQL